MLDSCKNLAPDTENNFNLGDETFRTINCTGTDDQTDNNHEKTHSKN